MSVQESSKGSDATRLNGAEGSQERPWIVAANVCAVLCVGILVFGITSVWASSVDAAFLWAGRCAGVALAALVAWRQARCGQAPQFSADLYMAALFSGVAVAEAPVLAESCSSAVVEFGLSSSANLWRMLGAAGALAAFFQGPWGTCSDWSGKTRPAARRCFLRPLVLVLGLGLFVLGGLGLSVFATLVPWVGSCLAVFVVCSFAFVDLRTAVADDSAPRRAAFVCGLLCAWVTARLALFPGASPFHGYTWDVYLLLVLRSVMPPLLVLSAGFLVADCVARRGKARSDALAKGEAGKAFADVPCARNASSAGLAAFVGLCALAWAQVGCYHPLGWLLTVAYLAIAHRGVAAAARSVERHDIPWRISGAALVLALGVVACSCGFVLVWACALVGLAVTRKAWAAFRGGGRSMAALVQAALLAFAATATAMTLSNGFSVRRLVFIGACTAMATLANLLVFHDSGNHKARGNGMLLIKGAMAAAFAVLMAVCAISGTGNAGVVPCLTTNDDGSEVYGWFGSVASWPGHSAAYLEAEGILPPEIVKWASTDSLVADEDEAVFPELDGGLYVPSAEHLVIWATYDDGTVSISERWFNLHKGWDETDPFAAFAEYWNRMVGASEEDVDEQLDETDEVATDDASADDAGAAEETDSG